MNRNEIALGVIPVQSSTTTRTDEKTGNMKTSTTYTKWALMAYYTDKSGAHLRVPFAAIQKHVGMGRENIVTVGSRDKLLAVAYVLGAAGFVVKPYVKGGAEAAVQRLKKRAEASIKRTEETIRAGKDAYLKVSREHAEKAWENMPGRLEDKRADSAKLDGILGLIRG